MAGTKKAIIKRIIMLGLALICTLSFFAFTDIETKAQKIDGKSFAQYVPNGYTGFALDSKNTWYYFYNGRIAWGWYGLAQGLDGNWYFSNGGYIDWNVSGLAYNAGYWFYVDHGKVNWKANTLCKNDYGWWKVTNGVVDFSFNGFWLYRGTWYYLKNGCIDWSYYGLGQGPDRNWYFSNGGYIDWNVTGLAYHYGGWYYVDRGWVRWNYNGQATLPGTNQKVNVVNSKVVYNTGGLSPSVSAKAQNVLNSIGYNLWAAYQYSKRPWKYDPNGPEKGTNFYAEQGFSQQRVNCYGMAATLVALARKLGYEAYQIAGYIPSRSGALARHSWAEIKYNGQFYVFDPDFEAEGYGSGWCIYYGKPGTWRYMNYYRMHD